MSAKMNLLKTQKQIVRIEQKDKDHFDVYFQFAEVPVTMNRQYLNTVLKDVCPDTKLAS